MREVLLAVPQRPPDNWPARIGVTVAVLVAFALIVLLMRRSWLRKAAADEVELLPLPVPPAGEATPLLPPSTGLYVGTTGADDWQARVRAAHLADRAAATLSVTAAGVRIDRDGADPLFIPVAALRGARLAPGLANKVVGGAGLLVLTWEHRGRSLDTGFRADAHTDHVTYRRLLTELHSPTKEAS